MDGMFSGPGGYDQGSGCVRRRQGSGKDPGEPDLVAHAHNPSTQEAHQEKYENFRASLGW